MPPTCPYYGLSGLLCSGSYSTADTVIASTHRPVRGSVAVRCRSGGGWLSIVDRRTVSLLSFGCGSGNARPAPPYRACYSSDSLYALRVADRALVDTDQPQHLVLDLQQVVGIEEFDGREQRVRVAVRTGVERGVLLQGGQGSHPIVFRSLRAIPEAAGVGLPLPQLDSRMCQQSQRDTSNPWTGTRQRGSGARQPKRRQPQPLRASRQKRTTHRRSWVGI